MKLIRLRIKNFKSFSRQIDLPITTGLTGVVGPNGCGKSNLTEAIRWVMGETSAKRLRGKGMSDVIFAGSKLVPASKFCEVEVYFDPHHPQQSEQWSGVEECIIKRTCEIEKGSAYSINGKPCRARDIQLFFADLGSGASSHAFVAQGHVTQLISQSPEERRHLLSEAAGAKGLEVRRKEILQKLSTSEVNLQRLKEILEIEKNQYVTLSFQAKKAESYSELSNNIRVYNNIILWVSWKKSIKINSLAKNSSLRLNESLQKLQSNLADNENLVLAKKQEKRKKSEQQDVINHKIKVAEVNIASIETRSETYEQRKKDLESQILIIEEDILNSNQRLGEIKQWITEHADKEIHHESLEASQKVEPSKIEEQKAELEKKLEGHRNKRKMLQNLIQDIYNKSNQRKLNLDNLKNQINIKKQEYNKCLDEIDKLNESYKDLNKQLNNRRQINSQSSQKLVKLNDEKQKLFTIVGLHRNQWQKSKEELTKSIREYDKESLDLNTNSKSIKAEIEGLSKVLMHLVDDSRANGVIKGLEMSNDLAEVVAMALGNDIQAETTATGDYYWITNEINLKQSGILKDSLWNKIKGPNCIKARMQRTLLVEDLVEGRQKQSSLEPGQIIVSKDGWLLTWDGIVCHVLRQSRRAQAVAIESKINSLKLLLKEKEINISKSRLSFKDKTQSLNYKVTVDNDRFVKVSNELSRINNEILNLVDSEKKYTDETGSLSFQLTHCLDNLNQKQKDETAIKLSVEEMLAQSQKLEVVLNNSNTNEITKVKQQIQYEEEREEFLTTKTRELKLSLQNHHEMKLRFQQQFKDWQQRNEWLAKELARQNNIGVDFEERLSDYSVNLEDVKSSLANKSNIIELQNNLRDLQENFNHTHEEIRVLDKLFDEISVDNAKLQSGILSKTEEKATCDEKNRLGQMQSDELIQKLEQELDEPVDDFINKNTELVATSLLKLKSKIQVFESERENIGSVNLRAANDAKSLLQTIDEKKNQEEDLELAINKLQKGIDEIDKDAYDKIYATLGKLKKEFLNLYTRLFGGGTASLELIEGDSLWSSGLEIYAAPPGKKVRTLSLLSGGEQTLTALSLLLAVHRLSKVPFCILDEVDAPLDDHNVEKFVNVLGSMFPRDENGCCFVVTHNRFTMSNVDKLLGVTMISPGVSQVVSVDLHQAVQYALVDN